MMTIRPHISKKNMGNITKISSLILLINLILLISTAFSRDVTFSWQANNDGSPVDGYRLYYKIGDPGSDLSDYDSTNASGGNPSPVTIFGNNLTNYTLAELLDTEKYSFVITAYRGNEESEPTAPLTLNPLSDGNSAPASSNLTISVMVNNDYEGNLPASDPDEDSLLYSIVTDANYGLVSLTNTATGEFSYSPIPGFTGGDSFTFKVNDGIVDSNTATVSITINSVELSPPEIIMIKEVK